jgi:hypothetical protein
MHDDLAVMRERREAHLSPLRSRSEDLREKLKSVDTQLEAAHVTMQNRGEIHHNSEQIYVLCKNNVTLVNTNLRIVS